MPRDREQGLRVARAGAERFGLEADSLRLIHDAPEGDGFVYEGTREGTATILKVGVADEQGLPAARAKAEFVAYLGNRGGQVATPYRSADGRLVETVRDGDSLLTLTAYRKAPGRPLNSADPRQCTHEVLAQWGRVLGRFHALAQEYEFGHRPCPAGEPLPQDAPCPIQDWRQEHAFFSAWQVDEELGRPLDGHLRVPSARALLTYDAHQEITRGTGHRRPVTCDAPVADGQVGAEVAGRDCRRLGGCLAPLGCGTHAG